MADISRSYQGLERGGLKDSREAPIMAAQDPMRQGFVAAERSEGTGCANKPRETIQHSVAGPSMDKKSPSPNERHHRKWLKTTEPRSRLPCSYW